MRRGGKDRLVSVESYRTNQWTLPFCMGPQGGVYLLVHYSALRSWTASRREPVLPPTDDRMSYPEGGQGCCRCPSSDLPHLASVHPTTDSTTITILWCHGLALVSVPQDIHNELYLPSNSPQPTVNIPPTTYLSISVSSKDAPPVTPSTPVLLAISTAILGIRSSPPLVSLVAQGNDRPGSRLGSHDRP